MSVSCVVLPTYNERENLQGIVDAIFRGQIPHEGVGSGRWFSRWHRSVGRSASPISGQSHRGIHRPSKLVLPLHTLRASRSRYSEAPPKSYRWMRTFHILLKSYPSLSQRLRIATWLLDPAIALGAASIRNGPGTAGY